MRYRSPLLRCLRGQQGVGATEYVILFVLAALATIALYSRYGRTVGGKVDVAGSRVGMMGQDQSGHIVDGSSSSSGTGESGAGASAAGGSSPSYEPLPEPIENAHKTTATPIDTRSVILLGILGLAVAALMILAIANRVRKDRKRARIQR